jgi:hypothetical protein
MSIKAKIETAIRQAENRRVEELRKFTAAEKSAVLMYEELAELVGTVPHYAPERTGRSIRLRRSDGALGTIDFADADKATVAFSYPTVETDAAPVTGTVDEAERLVAKFITEKHEG